MAGVLVLLKPCVRDWNRVLALGVLVVAGVAVYGALAFAFRLHSKRRM